MSHKLFLGLGVFAILIGVGACGRSDTRVDNVVEAPFDATYASLHIHVPVRTDLFQAANIDDWLTVQICARKVTDGNFNRLCKDLSSPLVNENGVRTFVSETARDIKFVHLKERPAKSIEPAVAPLIPIADQEIDRDIGGGGEAYYLSRLTLSLNGRWFTAAEGWPVAGCNRDPRGQHFCAVGFLINGAFTEAHWFPESGVELTQRDIWRVATAVDEKLRKLIK